MTNRPVSAIVLAGGRSSRFGRDKLREPLEGKALLDHAIDTVRSLASEVIVVVAPEAAPPVPSGVRVVHDAEAFEGPLSGLHAGLDAATETLVLVTAGDMPHLQLRIAEALLDALEAGHADVAVLEDADQPRPLPMAISRGPGLRAVASQLRTGERRLRSLFDVLTTAVVAETTWRTLDPQGRSLRDIDTPDDLPSGWH